MKMTRRELMVSTVAVTLPLQAQETGEMNAVAEALSKVQLPAGTEPAFAFKA